MSGIAPLDQAEVTGADLSLARNENPIIFTSPSIDTYLAGSLVNDQLNANVGGSRLIGGEGDDKLNGDIGDDIYLIRKGDGRDVITEKGGQNHIKFDKNKKFIFSFLKAA